jgi:hypothetical protein
MQDGLNAALGNTEADLVENRAGRLSAAQAERVRAATASDAVFMTGTAVVLAALLWGILGYLVHDGRLFSGSSVHGAGDGLALLALVLVAGVLPFAAVGWAGWTWVVHRRTEPKLERLEGTITLRIRRIRHVELHELQLSGATFGVTPRLYALLRSGARYRVYFVPLAQVVVAVEAMK